jgi:hypothetical protein
MGGDSADGVMTPAAGADLRDAVVVNFRATLPPPVFVLALPRSFTSLVGAMLGQHPQMFGLPETHLLCERTVASWLRRAAEAPWPMSHGLFRAIAQLHFGAQDERTVRWARDWVRSRAALDTEQMFKLIADRVFPLRVVDKSPSTIDNVETMQRALAWFPNAFFLHLVRHPRGYAESIIRLAGRKRQPVAQGHWLVRIASEPGARGEGGSKEQPLRLEPQHGWFERNAMIREFLTSLPTGQHMLLRGEDLLLSPDRTLERVADWLGLRADGGAIGEMKHPERSPFAFLGPPQARYGNDGNFLEDPELRPSRARVDGLEGPVSWRPDGEGFLPHVKELAEEFGYR